MKIALVHDYLREYGGAERVVEVFHELWPEAPLYTSFVDWQALGPHAERFRNWDIRTSWVQDNWLVRKFHSPLRFLAPQIWSSLDLSKYDVVLSSSGWFICRGVARKSTIHNRQPQHFCYIHHPPRNLYGYETGGLVEKYWPVKAYAMIINFFLRHYDYETAQRVDYFIANSKETARRVKKFYRRDSVVIYPPIKIQNLKSVSRRGRSKIQYQKNFYISVGRLTASKRIDILIQACNQLHLPLKIVGTGREEAELRKIAGPTIEFLGAKSDKQIAELYQQAKALLFCARNEDFGMVPVEAMAHGVPVIALYEGGVKETVTEGKTGVFFREPTVESLMEALQRFTQYQQDWSAVCRAQAQKFSVERFKKEMQQFVLSHTHTYARTS